MNKGIKIILLLLVLLVAGYFGATYWIGSTTESQWRQQVLALSAKTPGMDIKVTAYDRSFFSATVTTEIKLSMLQSGTEAAPGMIISSEVKHGPLIFSGGSPALVMATADTTIASVSGSWAEVFDKVPELKNLSFSDKVCLNLDYSGVGTLPAFERTLDTDEDRPLLRFGGLSTSYSGSLKGQKAAKGTISMPLISLTEEGKGHVEMKNAELQFDLKEALAEIYAGTTTMNLESMIFRISDATEPVDVTVNGLHAGVEINVTDGILSEVISYRLDQLGINGDNYGPAVMEVVFSNLDAEVLSQIQADLQQAQSAALEQTGADFSDQYVKSLMAHLLPLVKKSPKIEIRQLDVSTPFGSFVSKAQAQIAGEQVTSLEPPMLLLAALAADADLEMDKSLAKKIGVYYVMQSIPAAQAAAVTPEVMQLRAMQQATQTIDMLVGSNLLVEDGDKYRLKARYDRGSVFVNGTQMQ